MPERIPASTAKRVVFRAIAASDHFTPKTAVTIAITISKNGGAFGNPAAGATNATEISNGFYYFDLGTGDTGTGGPLAWRGAVATIDDVGDVYEVVNATNAGFTALPNVASGSAGAVIVSGTGTAALSVSSGLVTLAGVTHTGAVIPTVTTLTGHTAQTGDSFARLTGTGAVTLASLTVSGATTLTGNVAAQAGVNITQSSSNTSALVITGNGTGHGAAIKSGTGATGFGVLMESQATDGSGLKLVGIGSGHGMSAAGGPTGHGMVMLGGANGNGWATTGQGTGKGILVTNGMVTDTLAVTSTTTLTGAVTAPAGITANITGNITGNLSGSVGSVTGAVGSVTGSVGSVTGLTAANLDAAISTRATPAQVNTEVVDALATDTYAEPGQGAPAATASLAAKINYLYKAWRNKKTQTATTVSIYADDASTVDHKSTVSDDTTTTTIGEIATGP